MKIHIKALSRSTIFTIILIAIFTIWSGVSKLFKTFLVDITGHHWVTKGVFSLLFFVLLYFFFSKIYKDSSLNIRKETYYVIGSVILSGLAIFLFYILHFFG
jgi:cellulose synthase/poly-beta-1,6-N-acetylglucosamine synthase-like glycosyltransferase